MTTKTLLPEERYDRFFRAHRWIVPLVSLLTLAALYTGIALCMIGFRHHHYWTIFPAGLMAHAYFIIAIHDGSHRAITRTKLDDLFMNFFAGILLLPFFPEPFRRYHMIHHGNTNNEHDPLWAPVKSHLFSRSRYLYVLCQCVPMIFTFIVLMSGEKHRKKKAINGPQIRWAYMLMAFACSAAVIYFAKPPLAFYLDTLIFLNFLGAVRHWCEHMGTDTEKESNTYWFPLGMGVGNHAIHHDLPTLSWLSLALGLRKRKRDTNPFKTIWSMFFRRSFVHYKSHPPLEK